METESTKENPPPPSPPEGGSLSLIEDDFPGRMQRAMRLMPENHMGLGRRALFFAAITWLPIMLWALWKHRVTDGVDEPLLAHFGIHVRFLLALPLMILGEGWLHRTSQRVLSQFRTSGIVPDGEKERFEAIVGSFAGLRKKWWPWLLLVVVPLIWSFVGPTMQRFHELKWAEEAGVAHSFGFGGFWYRFVARPIFALFVGLWFWRLVLLFVFLWKVSKLDLDLVPTHPDHAAGLGFLSGIPKGFSLFILAVSSVVASQLAHDIIYHGARIAELKSIAGTFVVLITVLCLGPLLVFAGKLRVTRREGLAMYGKLIGEHGRQFRIRWILGQDPPRPEMLEAPEMGATCDTFQIYDAVKQINPLPLNKHAVAAVVLPAVLPMLAVAALQMPIQDILLKLAGALF
ncbi:MAG: hypothetical protein QM755_19015 [Luteolibacter sp.]